MSLRPIRQVSRAMPTLEGAGVHLRRAFGFGDTEDFDPVPAAGRLPQRRPGRTTAPASPGTRTGASRRSPTCWPARSSTATASATAADPRRRRRAVDDRGARDPPPGDAAGRSARPDARIPALGQPARRAQDDGAALPGRQGRATFRWSPTTTAPGSASSAAASGGGPVRSTASRPSPRYLDVSVPPGGGGRLPVETSRHAFAYVFAGAGRSATPRRRGRC